MRKSPPLKGDRVPPVALVPTTFTRRNETIAHLISNGYVAAEVAPLYGISRSQTSAIARAAGVGVGQGGSRRGYRTTDPLKIVAAVRAPGVVSKRAAASTAGVSLHTAKRVYRALGMQKSINRLLRLRRYRVRQAAKCRES